MSFICKGLSWASKNKLKIVSFGLLLAPGVYFVRGYLSDLRQTAEEEVEREKMKHEFFKKISFIDTINLEMRKLIDEFESTLNLPTKEEIAAQTRSQNKLKFWSDFILLNFTRVITLAYSITLFFVSIRIHLVLIGRYIYLSTQRPSLSLQMSEENRVYLESCEYFIHSGFQHLRNAVERNAEPVVSKWDLGSKCSFNDIKEIISDIRKEIQFSNVGNVENTQSLLINYLMEPESTASASNKSVVNLLQNETRNIFESNEFKFCIDDISDRVFSYILQKISNEFISKSNNDPISLVRIPTIFNNITVDIENELPQFIEGLCENQILQDLEWDIFDVQIEN